MDAEMNFFFHGNCHADIPNLYCTLSCPAHLCPEVVFVPARNSSLLRERAYFLLALPIPLVSLGP